MGSKSLSLNDIKVGMRVNPRQLDRILYTYIILTNRDNKDETSEIVYIGEKDNNRFQELNKQYDSFCVVYNTEEDLTEAWDE